MQISRWLTIFIFFFLFSCQKEHFNKLIHIFPFLIALALWKGLHPLEHRLWDDISRTRVKTEPSVPYICLHLFLKSGQDKDNTAAHQPDSAQW